MVKERAPPRVSMHPANSNDDNVQKGQSSDSDADIEALINRFSSKAQINDDPTDSLPPPPVPRPPQTLGHPPKMMSSRKQKADIFIRQKTRPEHHLDNRVNGPKAPVYRDRKAPPLPMFNSNANPGAPARLPFRAEEEFYTDPAKASEDLKALLEGGMDGDDEEGVEGGDDVAKREASPDDSKPQRPTKLKDSKTIISKDGVVNGLKVQLLPHQVEGVNWMRGRELGPVKKGTVPKGGLLADDMGLGKTLQTISLTLVNRKPNREDKGWKKHFDGIQKTTLVVAPLALIRQWEAEIRDKVDKTQLIKVLVHHGPQRTKRWEDLLKYDVVITTYQILVSEHGQSSDDEKGAKMGCFGLHWWRVVLDEAHTIKNRNAKATKACCALRSEYRWCLSGTPMQNNLEELQSLINFLRIKPYNDLKEWKEQIEKPIKNGKGHLAIKRLHTLLPCFMKRRTKEILKEDGALNPGGKTSAEGQASATGFRHTNRHVVTVEAEMSRLEREFYHRLEARADRSMDAMMRDKVNYASAFTLLLRLRQACNHPLLVGGFLSDDLDAISTGFQKSQDADVDAVADLFSSMGINTKSCIICGRTIEKKDGANEKGHCAECAADLAAFRGKKGPKEKAKNEKQDGKKKEDGIKRAKKIEKIKEEKEEDEDEDKASKKARRPRNRNAVIDSDDEEAEGSWLVPEGERGDLHLGKAGGSEDENAEGGGDTIGPEDSDDSSSEGEGSNLSSFIVKDEDAEDGYKSDDSLPSIADLTKQMASHTLEDSKAADLSLDSASENSSSSDEDDDDEDDDEEPPIVASAKIREIQRLLKAEAREHKFIVFSQFTSMLDLVEPFLQRDGLKFTRYDGKMRNDEREESLRRLREDKRTRVLLCSLKCGSLGLNLTAATRVIIIEPFWNPFVEEQAIDRVHRLTQTVDVKVYKLTVKGTIEAGILDMQDKKRQLAEQTIEGSAKKGVMKLGINEIIELFRPIQDHYAREAREEEERLGPQAVRDAALLIRKGRKKEDSVYGRRW